MISAVYSRRNSLRFKTLVFAVALAISLNSAFAGNGPTLTDENSDLYFGYYVEDPVNNPEDPTPGALLLRLPKTDAAFSGALFFTFIGCQSESWGHIEGELKQGKLQGKWSGAVDDIPQDGTFQGKFDAQAAQYAGTYDNSKGKQYREIPNCITYHIAARGTWQMFKPGSLADGNLSLNAQWPYVLCPTSPKQQIILLYVLDKKLLNSADPQNAVLAQFLVLPNQSRQRLPTAKMQEGHEYLVVGMAFDAEMKPVGRGSVTVTKRQR
jgi:hypothetical protein